MLSLVVAHDKNLLIGKDNWMPWDLPEDLKHFKATTLNHKIIMGRTTFEAMKKPLPKRHTFVITRDTSYTYEHEDVTIINDFDAFLKQCKESEELYIVCGGAQIYTQALPYVDEMWISLVEGDFEGDTFFPSYDVNEFVLATKESKPGFLILHYLRK